MPTREPPHFQMPDGDEPPPSEAIRAALAMAGEVELLRKGLYGDKETGQEGAIPYLRRRENRSRNIVYTLAGAITALVVVGALAITAIVRTSHQAETLHSACLARDNQQARVKGQIIEIDDTLIGFLAQNLTALKANEATFVKLYGQPEYNDNLKAQNDGIAALKAKEADATRAFTPLACPK